MSVPIDVTFSSGVVISSPWLNGINDHVQLVQSADGASVVGYTPNGTGAVATNLETKLHEFPSVKDFGAVGDGVTDDYVALQAALNSGSVVTLPVGVYCTSQTLIIPDGGGFVGVTAFWKRRTAYVYSNTKHSVIKYIGSSGSNTCVIRASKTAVGIVGTDFSGPDTDDLVSYVLRDFHVDANNLADFGIYIYRGGNQSNVGNITAEKAVVANHVHLGCYAANFGVFGAYESAGQGVICGWDIFAWGSVEATNFAYKATFALANNGTSQTYVAGTGTDEDNSGGKFSVGRGSIVYITSESNYGRACVLSQHNIASATGGTTEYILAYIEGNGSGPSVDYRDGMDSIRLSNGFLHPGNGSTLLPQDIKIVGKNNAGTVTANSGPVKQEEWLTLYRLFGDLSGVGPTIDSNTIKYRIFECSPYFQFAASRPGATSFNLTLEGATTPGSQTYSLRSGYATRYGNIVHVTGRITLSALDGATAGQIRISGLPYRISNSSNLFGSATIGSWNALNTAVIQLSGILSSNTSYIALNKLTAAGTSNLTTLVPADLTNTSLIQFSATYITDDL